MFAAFSSALASFTLLAAAATAATLIACNKSKKKTNATPVPQPSPAAQTQPQPQPSQPPPSPSQPKSSAAPPPPPPRQPTRQPTRQSSRQSKRRPQRRQSLSPAGKDVAAEVIKIYEDRRIRKENQRRTIENLREIAGLWKEAREDLTRVRSTQADDSAGSNESTPSQQSPYTRKSITPTAIAVERFRPAVPPRSLRRPRLPPEKTQEEDSQVRLFYQIKIFEYFYPLTCAT